MKKGFTYTSEYLLLSQPLRTNPTLDLGQFSWSQANVPRKGIPNGPPTLSSLKKSISSITRYGMTRFLRIHCWKMVEKKAIERRERKRGKNAKIKRRTWENSSGIGIYPAKQRQFRQLSVAITRATGVT